MDESNTLFCRVKQQALFITVRQRAGLFHKLGIESCN